MVTRTEVEMAYRLLLGREPENENAVNAQIAKKQTLAQLRNEFLNSDEFRSHITPGVKPLDWRRNDINMNAGDHLLDKMMIRIQEQFQFLGETEPYWSVLSDDSFKLENIDQTETDFYATGSSVVEEFKAAISRYDIDISRHQRCFELGCGLGRTTVWLSKLFDEVVATDVSRAHLDCANINLAKYGTVGVSQSGSRQLDSSAGRDVAF